ncbi:alpha/beta hydrolase-fold protein [Sphingomicrobium sp. XHP0239]|uniref:alpha/beta hydrolase n=1 Tax=Sphingomicrobium maritimum TaxID=3133972 RepID=UPI0031CC917C
MDLLRIALISLLFATPTVAFAQDADKPLHANLADPDGEPIVVGSIHRLDSAVYGGEQILTVRLPRGYADEPDRTYPVVFSVDGGPDQDFELLAGIAAEAEFSTSFEPFILIGVQTEDRYRQLTPPTTMPDELNEAFAGRISGGGAATFRRYLAEEVMPWALSRYRTDRKILTSVSLGGLFVLDTFAEAPEMFDDYIALTPSTWWDQGAYADTYAAKLADHGPSDRRLYVTLGDEGVGNDQDEWLSKILDTLEADTPAGLKWAFVDRSGSEEHRTMALISWLDAFRTLYLLPGRTGNSLPLAYADGVRPTAGPVARANLDAGECRREIARTVSYETKNADPDAYYGWCLLMKPGSQPTRGNFTPDDYGRPVATDE